MRQNRRPYNRLLFVHVAGVDGVGVSDCDDNQTGQRDIGRRGQSGGTCRNEPDGQFPGFGQVRWL